MQVRMERLRVLVVLLALLGVAAAAINTKVGALFLAGLLVVLLLAAVARWVLAPADREAEQPRDPG